MKKVLFISAIFPEPTSSAAGTRIVQLVQFFFANKYEVLFASTAEKSPFSYDLESIGVKTLQIKVNDSTIDNQLKEINPTIVVFDRFFMEEQFGWRIAESCPKAIRILDTEDLHFIRKQRHQSLKDKELNSSELYRELASIYRCDLSLIISKFEYEYLLNSFPSISELIHYLPFLYEKNDGIITNFEERENLVFIGNFLHEPNIDAVLFLKHEVWPILRKQNRALKLLVYGAYMPEKINKLHQESENFLVLSRVESAYEVLQNAKLLLAPLRFGAGLKGKVMEAMICGTPFITSQIGGEGIIEKDNFSIAEDPEQLVQKVIELYFNKSQWLHAQKQGFQLIDEQFSKIHFETQFLEKLLLLEQQLTEIRRRNFIGSMLLHHTTSSAKFMSKWIEEKNKI